jgi:hypothetical protein
MAQGGCITPLKGLSWILVQVSLFAANTPELLVESLAILYSFGRHSHNIHVAFL